MQRKSNVKNPLCQVPELTPEQKKIQRLEKRLKKEKDHSELRWQWWRESEALAKQYKKQWEESAQKANILYSLSNTTMTQFDIMLSMKNRAEKEANEWRTKFEQLKHEKDAQADVSSNDGNALRDMIEQGLSLQEIIDQATPEQLIEISKAQRTIKSKRKKEFVGIKPGPLVHLICINAADWSQLDEYSRYTSSGLIEGEEGGKFYPIKELCDKWFPAEYFHVSTAAIVLGKTCTEAELLAYEKQQRENETRIRGEK